MLSVLQAAWHNDNLIINDHLINIIDSEKAKKKNWKKLPNFLWRYLKVRKTEMTFYEDIVLIKIET